MTVPKEPGADFAKQVAPQVQHRQPGIESVMNPLPVYDHPSYNKQRDKLLDKVAIITGGDSGIGRAIAFSYAKEGCDIVISYYDEHDDAKETQKIVEALGRRCLLVAGDIADPQICEHLVQQTIDTFGKLNILVNNAAMQFPHEDVTHMKFEDIKRTFDVNIIAPIYLSQLAIPHLHAGDSILNTTSVTAYQGHESLIDYSSTKGALTTFTRSLASQLASKHIRVNAVAPGPIWTPLIPASNTDPNQTAQHGVNAPLGRPGQPVEHGAAFVFLASDDASYITGITLHINGGTIVNC